MHKFNEYLKVMLVAGLIAFASTVSAVHVHPLLSCEAQDYQSVRSELTNHDCLYCLVVYQILTVDMESTKAPLIANDQEQGTLDILLPCSLNSSNQGRAPPISA